MFGVRLEGDGIDVSVSRESSSKKVSSRTLRAGSYAWLLRQRPKYGGREGKVGSPRHSLDCPRLERILESGASCSCAHPPTSFRRNAPLAREPIRLACSTARPWGARDDHFRQAFGARPPRKWGLGQNRQRRLRFRVSAPGSQKQASAHEKATFPSCALACALRS